MLTPIRKILIANRSEIAIRVMRTCRAMGIETVAVFSDADAGAAHVQLADEAVRIGPPPALESYLAIDKVLFAAERTGADAIHPGYGFLAENADFARACAERGLTFIGPSPEVIRTLGSKRESKRIAIEAGVPVIPGYHGAEQDLDTLAARAREIGFPVLIKASAGGGGKGMRVVGAEDALFAAIESARREARSAFGDDTLLIETYIDRPRHVEIQILGDHHGNLVHLFERECSIQRRHQKIVEEAPSPALDDALRHAMGEAAVALGKAVGYVNAGTVEFILAPDRRFYFLEVNTRLQVEHPVTECVTGMDLVREQIRIARGEPLHDIRPARPSGAAIECRLYAEDTKNDLLPTTGRVLDWHVPPDVPGLRVDAGVQKGQEVGIYYDPMLAKIICHAPTRAEAIQKLIYSLRGLSVHGVITNRELLIRILTHAEFQRGHIHTHFLTDHAADLAADHAADLAAGLAAPALDADLVRDAAIAAALVAHEHRRRSRTILPRLEPGFRNSRFRDERVTFAVGEELVAVCYHNLGRGRFRIGAAIGAAEPELHTVALVHGTAPEITPETTPEITPEITIEGPDGLRQRFRVIRDDDRHFVQSRRGALTLVEVPRFPRARAAAEKGGCLAPMPGRIIKILVSEGQAVKAGDTLVVVEAMKMEHAIKAPEDGIIVRIAVAQGDQVDTEQLLVVIAPTE
jgi:acetyl-CoA carboxylase biotin carboxylase subunit